MKAGRRIMAMTMIGFLLCASMATAEEPIRVTVDELVNLYRCNRIKFQNLYEGKFLEVTGKVWQIGEVSPKNGYIILYSAPNKSIIVYYNGKPMPEGLDDWERDRVVTLDGYCSANEKGISLSRWKK